MIKKHIESLLDGPPSPMQAMASRHNALPVRFDMGGTSLLTPDGEIIFIDGEIGEQAPLPQDIDWALVARIAAAKKYPDLFDLLPQRPESAPDCSACSGTGQVYKNAGCGECLGLGWVR